MHKDILRSIVGIEVFPLVSLLIFVAVFAAVLVWAVRVDRRRLDVLAAIPLTDGSDAPDRPGEAREGNQP